MKQEGSILDVLTEMGQTTVLELIEAAGLSEALDTDPGISSLVVLFFFLQAKRVT